MTDIVDEFSHKLMHGQSVFRRSTVFLLLNFAVDARDQIKEQEKQINSLRQHISVQEDLLKRKMSVND